VLVSHKRILVHEFTRSHKFANYLGVDTGKPTRSTHDEPSDSALYIHTTYDTKVTWQISSGTQCNSDTSGKLQFTWISNRYL